MSGECNICGVMGCVESNHKETNVSEQTPAQIAAAIVRRELDAYYVSPRPMSQQAERFDLREAIADAIREAQTSSAAARDGEVGRYKAALEEIAQDEASGYGCYHGGDPRMFHPDSESCTPEELAAHKKACDEWTEAENAAKPSPDAPCPSGWIGPNIHVNVAPFGIGCYMYPSHTALIARSALAPGNGGEGKAS